MPRLKILIRHFRWFSNTVFFLRRFLRSLIKIKSIICLTSIKYVFEIKVKIKLADDKGQGWFGKKKISSFFSGYKVRNGVTVISAEKAIRRRREKGQEWREKRDWPSSFLGEEDLRARSSFSYRNRWTRPHSSWSPIPETWADERSSFL